MNNLFCVEINFFLSPLSLPSLLQPSRNLASLLFRRPLCRSRSPDSLFSPPLFLSCVFHMFFSPSFLFSLRPGELHLSLDPEIWVSDLRSPAASPWAWGRRVSLLWFSPLVSWSSGGFGAAWCVLSGELWRVWHRLGLLCGVSLALRSGFGSWLALTRSFVAGFLFLLTLGLLGVLPVTARGS